MTVRIENASGSLAYVRARRLVSKEPIAQHDGVKTYGANVLQIVVSTLPLHESPETDESGVVAPGQIMTVDSDCDEAEFDFAQGDAGAVNLAYEDIEAAETHDDIGYRIVQSGIDKMPPKNQRH